MNKNRFLNMAYGVEVLNGRINGSSSQVEISKSGFDNITFTKKVNGKGYVSAPCVKKGIKEYMEQDGLEVSSKTKIGKKIITDADPIKKSDEDIFGFMLASNGILTEEGFNELTEDEQQNYKKGKEGYKLNIELTKEQYEELTEAEKRTWKASKGKYIPVEKSTTKRKACMSMNGLIGVGTSRIREEFGVCETTGDSMPYVLETYSDMMSGLANLNINQVGNFTMGDKSVSFKDYDVADGIEEKNLILPKEERFKRIETLLRGTQYLSIKTNQSNHLVDTMPKIVIMAEYSYGNNVFQGLITKNGINIEGLRETIEECDRFRMSNIYIGISSKIMNEKFQGLKKILEEQLREFDFIQIGTVKSAFDGYLEYLKCSL
jgi:CRISPR-associated protein Cst2